MFFRFKPTTEEGEDEEKPSDTNDRVDRLLQVFWIFMTFTESINTSQALYNPSIFKEEMSLSSESIKEDSRQPPKLSNLMEDVFRSIQKKLILVYDKVKLKDVRQF